MKAVIKYAEEAGSLEVKEVDIPKPKKNEVLIQIKASSICGTDMSILYNKYLNICQDLLLFKVNSCSICTPISLDISSRCVKKL